LLLVDDDPTYRALVRHALRLRFIVSEATNGLEALDRLAENIPEILLLDMEMPGLSGLETLIRIRLLRQMRHVPIIMVTAISERETIIESMKAGAADYLLKNSHTTKELVDRVLSHVPGFGMARDPDAEIDEPHEGHAQPVALRHRRSSNSELRQ